jgi:hypothetical protein
MTAGLFERTHLHFYMWDGWKSCSGLTGSHVLSVEPSAIPRGRLHAGGSCLEDNVRAPVSD